jgi:hypothetical protein
MLRSLQANDDFKGEAQTWYLSVFVCITLGTVRTNARATETEPCSETMGFVRIHIRRPLSRSRVR